jgi:hypothetical protein
MVIDEKNGEEPIGPVTASIGVSHPSQNDSMLTLERISSIRDVNTLLPQIKRGAWRAIKIAEAEWASLEAALGRPINEELRRSLCGSVAYFIHSLRLKKNLPTPRQYATSIQKRLAEISTTTENVLAMITPTAPPPAELTPISDTAARWISGGSDAHWMDAERASRTTPDDYEVMLVEDHVRALIHANTPATAAMVYNGMMDLLRVINAMRNDISKMPRNQAGPDGNYELNLFLVEILRIAKAAGDDLDLTHHLIRDQVMRKTVKPNPAYLFAERVVLITLAAAETLVSGLALPENAAAELLALIKKNLGRKSGTLIDPLEAARTLIEGGPRK